MNLRMTADEAWITSVRKCLGEGIAVAPRGKKILELQQHTVCIDMLYPVMTLPSRRLNYRFMAAEALWILVGSDQLSMLTPYNPNMAQFSDDGETLEGAYGPRIAWQLGYCLKALLKDRDTRQATLTIWTPSPAPSKDIPCTVAMDFKIRGGRLNTHVFMRSSDLYLGVPYDVFSFTCVAYYLVASFNYLAMSHGQQAVVPGSLYLTAASSHLYDDRWDDVYNILQHDRLEVPTPTPMSIWSSPTGLINALTELRDTKKGDPRRWWEIR